MNSYHIPKSLLGLAIAAALPAPAAAMSAVETAAAVCNGSANAASIVADAIERAQNAAPLNAMITLDADRATEIASALDKSAKTKRCAPLAGVPIVVKDNTHVAGLPSTAGSPALKSFVPKLDAPVVARLRKAGAIVIGKSNMHELAFGISGFNPAFQTGDEPGVRNAYKPTHVAGGSSSGTGAAIGAGVVPAGLGTDTGGSVRVPCAFNGCAGLRPTMGRYPSDGIAPISHTRDTPGPMAKTMADIELLDRVITDAPKSAAASLTGVRLGLASQMLANLDADTKQVFDAAIDKLRRAGVEIVAVDAAELSALNGAVGFPVALYEAYDDMVSYLAKYETGITIKELAKQIASPDVKGTYEGLVLTRKLPGPDNTLVDAKPAYDQAIGKGRSALQAFYQNLFKDNQLDALVFPTSPIVAMKANPESSNLKYFGLVIQNTDPAGNAGIPGLQIPAGIGPKSGLPVGLELDGPAGSDRRLIALGMAIEQVLGQIPAPER